MIRRIKLRNWKRMTGEYDLGPLTYITGPNGSGKSAIIQALQYAITDEIPGVGKDVRAAAKLVSGREGMVMLEADEGVLQKSISVDRKMQGQVVFRRGSIILQGRQAKGAIQAAFQVAWPVNQDYLLLAGPSEKKALLSSILSRVVPDFGVLEERVQELKKGVNELRAQARKLKEMLDLRTKGLPPSNIVEVELGQVRAELAELEGRIKGLQDQTAQTRKRELEARIQELKAQVRKRREKHQPMDLEELDQKIQRVEEEVRAKESVVSGHDAQELEALERRKAELLEKAMRLRQIKESLSVVKETGKCPIDEKPCPRDWNADIGPISEELEQVESELRVVKAGIQEMRALADQDLERQKEITQLLHLQKTLEARKQMEEEIQAMERELKDLEAEYQSLPDPAADILHLLASLEERRQTLEQRKEELERAVVELRTIQELESQVTEVEEALAARKEELKAAEEELGRKLQEGIARIGLVGRRFLEIMGLPGYTPAFTLDGRFGLMDQEYRFLDLAALSQGQRVIYWVAFSLGLFKEMEGLRILFLEGAELDKEHLEALMIGLAQAREEGLVDQVFLATWVDIEKEVQGWTTIRLS